MIRPLKGPDRSVPLRLPLFYLALAHLSLALACLALAADPHAFLGFFIHPGALAVTHLITLGWITSSILGVMYLLAPMALRSRLPVRRADRWVAVGFALGLSGMVAHFWLAEWTGVAWSGSLVAAGPIYVTSRLVKRVAAAPVASGVRLYYAFALGNFVLAAALGILSAVDRVVDVLPGDVLSHIHGHSHLAAVGWATLVAFGSGARLLPMILPSAVPRGGSLVLAAVWLEAGVLAMAVCAIAFPSGLRLASVWVVAGLGAFLLQVLWMARHRRRGAKGRQSPDYGTIQIALSLAYLLAAAGLGMALTFSTDAEWKLRMAPVYGVLGLLGFLGQLIVAVSHRLMPLYSWLRSQAVAGRPPALSPHRIQCRSAQLSALICWTVAIPCLAGGLAAGSGFLVALGAWALLGGTAGNGLGIVVALRRGRRWAEDPPGEL